MALSRPTKLYPDKASGDYSAIDGTSLIAEDRINLLGVDDNAIFIMRAEDTNEFTDYISQPFTFTVGGSSPIHKVSIDIFDIDNNIVFASEKISANSTLYPINYLGEETIIKCYIPVTNDLGQSYLKTEYDANYKWVATVYWQEKSQGEYIEKYLSSTERYFESRKKLKISKVIIDEGTTNQITYKFDFSEIELEGLEHTFKAICEPTNDEVSINYFYWKLYDANGLLIYDTGQINSPDVKFHYNGFIPLDYRVEVTVANIAGHSITKDFDIKCVTSVFTQLITTTQLIITNLPEESGIHIRWNKSDILDYLSTMGADGDLIGYDLYRRKKGDLYLQYLFTFSNMAYECIDYLVANDSEYAYFLYPLGKIDDKIYASFGYVSNFIEDGSIQLYTKANFEGWHLLVLTPNENQERNIYKVFEHYIWALNMSNVSMKNNANISVNTNYTQYPRVQRGRTNYMTFTLKGLIGYLDYSTQTIINDTQEAIDNIRYLPSINHEMILKSPKGGVYKVTPISEIELTVDESLSELLTSMSIEFAEVGSSRDISIVNKVFNSSWMFTKYGYQPINTLSTNLAGYKLEPNTILTGSTIIVE